MSSKDPLLDLKKYEEVVAACNRCGFCTSYCPTYLATGSEVHSPRGRNQTVRALIEGKLRDPRQALESIDTCVLCGECTSVCFSEVPTAELMVHARHYLNSKLGIPFFLSFFLKHVLPYPKRLYWILKISFIGKRLGIAWILNKSGILARLSPAFAAADNLLSSPPLKFLLDHKEAAAYQDQVLARQLHVQELARQKGAPENKTPTAPTPATHQTKIAFLPACGGRYLRPSIGLALIELFKILKVDFVIPEGFCCGLPAASYGVAESVADMAKRNITALERGHFENIVIDDSSCLAHFKDYPKVFQNDAAWLLRAHTLAQKFRDISNFLLQKGLKENLRLSPWKGGTVAFHDPCKAQYGLKLTNPPRELLAAIPNLKLLPIADADQCCGGGGTYSFVHPEMSQQVLEAKIKNIKAAGCSLVVTSSASCLVQLSSGLRDAQPKVEVLHLTEFLLRALRKNFAPGK